MCGIVGCWGNYEPELINNMNDSIAHRGPDGEGIYRDKKSSLSLGHRRLSIIDLSDSGRQPMLVKHDIVIIYNGEVYNYRELKEKLIKKGYVFRGTSDTEVVINMYLEFGFDFLEQLNGIFALAIWDPREKHLLLARDGLGVKPLYYTENSKGFIFSSELKSILHEKSIDKEINARAITSYLSFLWSPPPDTMLKCIKKLEPGRALLVKDSKIKKSWSFYELPVNQPISTESPAMLIEKMDHLLKQAVEKQMVSDVQVGAFLSGGLDSSSLVAMVKNLMPDYSLPCFTIDLGGGFKQEGFQEDLPYAKMVANHLNVELNVIEVTPDIASDFEKMIYLMDEPQADPAPINSYYITEAAKKSGVKVLLSGAGGDDLFTGYRRHLAVELEKYWGWLPVSMRQLASKLSESLPVKNPYARRFKKMIQYAPLNQKQRICHYFRWCSQSVMVSLLSKDIISSLGDFDYQDPLMETLNKLPNNVSRLKQALHLDTKHFLTDHNLNYTDKTSMASGVEVRVPLLDQDLVNFSNTVPDKYLQRGSTGKWIFKKTMEKYLPAEVIYRPKTGFGAPLRSWLNKDLKPIVEDTLSIKSIKNRGLFDPMGVQNLIKMDQSGKEDYSYIIYALASIEVWCRLFLDNSMANKSYYS